MKKVIWLLCFLSLSAHSGDVGVGFMIGEPTGFSAKKLLGENALDMGVGWAIGGGHEFQIHGDWLWNKPGLLFFKESQPLDLYFGLGSQMVFADEIEVGVRLPLGLSAYSTDRVLEIFGEIAPILEVAPDSEVHGQLLVGLRIYL